MPIRPNGTLTQKTARQCHSDSTPPRIRPMNEPAIAATMLTPSAVPRWLAGNASVRIAVELANSIAPPTPWTRRQPMIQSAPPEPSSGSIASSTELRKKTRKPRL